MGDATSSDRTSDLARIRDNQRRSRARRKEYLQELETKWRQCEQVGIEASAEIQAAARKVVDENKRLRALLVKHGISEQEIENSNAGFAANLNAMLNTKRSCGGDGGGCRPSRITTTASASSSPYLRTQPTPTTRSPLSTTSSQNTSNNYSSPGPGPLSGGYPPPSSNILPPNTPTTTTGYDHQSNTSPANWSTVSDPAYYSAFHDTYELPPATMDPNASSCRAVADAIRYIRPGVGGELETEMGCADGADCDIPTTQAFDLMDRFSGEGLSGQ